MERRGLVEFLQDINRSIDAIDRFVVGVDFESFAMNEEKATKPIAPHPLGKARSHFVNF